MIYTQYEKCDPKSAGLIKADDQLYPLFVMQSVGDLHGIPGLFIAGVFGAALSSLSVVLNSTAAVIHEDIIKGFFNVRLEEQKAFWVVKSIILILGILTLCLMMVVEKLGSVLGVATALTSIASGTSFGVFTLGMLNPWCTSKGAIIGGVSGAIASGTVCYIIIFTKNPYLCLKLCSGITWITNCLRSWSNNRQNSPSFNGWLPKCYYY